MVTDGRYIGGGVAVRSETIEEAWEMVCGVGPELWCSGGLAEDEEDACLFLLDPTRPVR